MKLLLIGGTRFMGRHLAALAPVAQAFDRSMAPYDECNVS